LFLVGKHPQRRLNIQNWHILGGWHADIDMIHADGDTPIKAVLTLAGMLGHTIEEIQEWIDQQTIS
jgi:hypothetical protein